MGSVWQFYGASNRKGLIFPTGEARKSTGTMAPKVFKHNRGMRMFSDTTVTNRRSPKKEMIQQI